MAAKDKSAIVSGMGLGMSIIQALVEKARKRGVPDETIRSLATPEGDAMLEQFAEIIARANVTVPNFTHNKTRDGWELLENTPRRITSIHDLELVPFLKGGENCVNGEEMLRRARVELDANFGQEDAEHLLANRHEIPAEFRKYYLIFPGTVWRSPSGFRHVPYLGCVDVRWVLYFGWLGDDWYPSVRLVRPRESR